jgi:hypothetical protein
LRGEGAAGRCEAAGSKKPEAYSLESGPIAPGMQWVPRIVSGRERSQRANGAQHVQYVLPGQAIAPAEHRTEEDAMGDTQERLHIRFRARLQGLKVRREHNQIPCARPEAVSSGAMATLVMLLREPLASFRIARSSWAEIQELVDTTTRHATISGMPLRKVDPPSQCFLPVGTMSIRIGSARSCPFLIPPYHHSA